VKGNPRGKGLKRSFKRKQLMGNSNKPKLKLQLPVRNGVSDIMVKLLRFDIAGDQKPISEIKIDFIESGGRE